MQNKMEEDGEDMDTPLNILKLISSEDCMYVCCVIINEVVMVTGGKVQRIVTIMH